METSPGLTIEDAQHAICKGTYKAKEWSSAERQAACVRYEELTGTKPESSYKSADLSIVTIILALLLAIILGYVVYRRKAIRKISKMPHSHKTDQK